MSAEAKPRPAAASAEPGRHGHSPFRKCASSPSFALVYPSETSPAGAATKEHPGNGHAHEPCTPRHLLLFLIEHFCRNPPSSLPDTAEAPVSGEGEQRRQREAVERVVQALHRAKALDSAQLLADLASYRAKQAAACAAFLLAALRGAASPRGAAPPAGSDERDRDPSSGAGSGSSPRPHTPGAGRPGSPAGLLRLTPSSSHSELDLSAAVLGGRPPPAPALASRYEQDYEELGRLGTGGYGSVWRARNRLDGLDYAVKKIRLRAAADAVSEKVLREVKALARLTHPNVIRYYTSWVERPPPAAPGRLSTSSSSLGLDGPAALELHSNMAAFSLLGGGRGGAIPRSGSVEGLLGGALGRGPHGAPRPGALALLAEANHNSSLVLTPSEATDLTPDPAAGRRSASLLPRRADAAAAAGDGAEPMTLYITMQLCECTLHDWLDRPGRVPSRAENLSLFRQLLQGLAYIHALGLVHRDCKPSNLFLFFRAPGHLHLVIGDFGLARDAPSSSSAPDLVLPPGAAPVRVPGAASDATAPRPCDGATSLGSSSSYPPPASPLLGSAAPHSGRIGTRLYSAPELERRPSPPYTAACDMYSVGVILVELCCAFPTRMERGKTLAALRGPGPARDLPLPAPLCSPELVEEAALARALLAADPELRPAAASLLAALEQRDEASATASLRRELAAKDQLIARLQAQLPRPPSRLVSSNPD